MHYDFRAHGLLYCLNALEHCLLSMITIILVSMMSVMEARAKATEETHCPNFHSESTQ